MQYRLDRSYLTCTCIELDGRKEIDNLAALRLPLTRHIYQNELYARRTRTPSEKSLIAPF